MGICGLLVSSPWLARNCAFWRGPRRYEKADGGLRPVDPGRQGPAWRFHCSCQRHHSKRGRRRAMTEEDNRYGRTQSQPPGDRGHRDHGGRRSGVVLSPGPGRRRPSARTSPRPSLQATAVSPQPTSTSPQPTPTARPLALLPRGPRLRQLLRPGGRAPHDGPGHLPPLTRQRRRGAVLREGAPGGPAGQQPHRQPGLRLRVRPAGGRDEGHQQPAPHRGRALQRHLRHDQPAVGRASLRVPVPAGFQGGNVATNAGRLAPSSPSPPTSPPRRATTCPPSSGST